ncbi:serine/threonine kinase 17a like [Brienomyrus brachyistius]|uniref:serine/threonine kinase 17a like n=1 Tax=Brienomyrus brachyistius TaxID=42636 RepID=UPI0020B269D4|nr:serine/threonine kinase 17a like [Brienomyrus brachyistius]
MMMNKNGMVSKIQTRIRTEPFKNYYDLVGRELGRGKFAVVKKCVEKSTGKEHAAKFLRKRRKGQDCRMDIINEIAVLESAAANPFVVSLHEVFETTSEIVLLLECAAGGEIFSQCVGESDDAFTEKDVIRLARQILTGVAGLHLGNVVHLDLKPQNILLTSSCPLGDIRIVDFGLSRHVDSADVREILGTPEYVAPEILNYEPISTATDMWSIGVLTYVMLTGVSPFLGDEKQETFLNISQVNVEYPADIFQGISSLAVDFIKSLLIKDPRQRATAEDCLKHPWLDGHSGPLLHLRTDLLSENSQSESDPESPMPSPELVIVASYTTCSGQSERKVARGPFPFDEPFPTRSEIKQELIC